MKNLDKVQDNSFDRVLRAQKEVQDQVWKVYNPTSSFSMDANGDYSYDKNGLLGPYDAKDAKWQSKVNQWRADYNKNPRTGFGRKTADSDAVETFKYSSFNNYRKADGTRNLDFVKDYLKVRDTMMLYGNITGKNVFPITGITHEYDILVAQDELARGIFLSLFKQKYYGKGYRDIDEELKFLLPGVFTNFSDSLTFDGKSVYDKYTPAYLTRYFNGDNLSTFSNDRRKEMESSLIKVSDAISATRSKYNDENAYLKSVLAYAKKFSASAKSFETKYRNNRKDYESFYAMHRMTQAADMLNAYVAFHSVSKYPVNEPMREYYNIASLDANGNAVFSKKTTVVRKLK